MMAWVMVVMRLLLTCIGCNAKAEEEKATFFGHFAALLLLTSRLSVACAALKYGVIARCTLPGSEPGNTRSASVSTMA